MRITSDLEDVARILEIDFKSTKGGYMSLGRGPGGSSYTVRLMP